MLMPYLTPYIHKEVIAQAAAAAIVFFVTLIVVSLFTVRLSDLILDSKIGALDRSLGFVFGVARGVSSRRGRLRHLQLAGLGEAATGMGQERQNAAGARRDGATRIVALLPADAAQTINGWIKSHANAATNDFAPNNAERRARRRRTISRLRSRRRRRKSPIRRRGGAAARPWTSRSSTP